MFKKQCYKVIEASLTWTQAQTLCRRLVTCMVNVHMDMCLLYEVVLLNSETDTVT